MSTSPELFLPKRDPEIQPYLDSSIPAYQQIKNYVLDQIQRSVWREGDMIPTELALCERFKVSRMTVNRALRELAADGLLLRYKGSGTFVAPQKIQSTLVEIRNIADDIRARGNTYHGAVLHTGTCQASTAQARRFEIRENSLLFRSIIVHHENTLPVQLEDRLVDARIIPDYLSQDWTHMTPNEYLTRCAPMPTGHYSLEARLPTREVMQALEVSHSEPCLVLDRITRSGGVFVSQATMWHPGSRYRFTGEL